MFQGGKCFWSGKGFSLVRSVTLTVSCTVVAASFAYNRKQNRIVSFWANAKVVEIVKAYVVFWQCHRSRYRLTNAACKNGKRLPSCGCRFVAGPIVHFEDRWNPVLT